MAERKFVNPPGLKALGQYSHVTCGSGGTTMYMSGQVAVDEKGEVVGVGDLHAQAVQIFENIKVGLESVGGSWKDVLKITMYVKELTQEARSTIVDVRSRYISHENPPAATMIGIDQLVLDELLLEIEVIAVID